ncbi:MAG: 3-dehydroquinate synthase [Hyphomicrobiales bacterium]
MNPASEIIVELGARSYAIQIGPGLLARAGAFIAPLLKRPKTVIVTDDNVARLHLERLEAALDQAAIASTSVVVPAGEQSKNFDKLADVCEKLLDAGVERQDTIIAFGGGVVGDLAGFAAAILRRGVEFIQIPTTLLAQVDSSVGGKTGINAASGKNLIGAFHQPVLVLADIDVLDTLPERELKAGYAEVAKYGLIADAAFYGWLEDNADGLFAGDAAARITAIETSCRAKAALVAQDEREAGARALLNLGHTFGHALEAATGYSDRLLHGEGVAIGTVLAHRFSERLGHCAQGCGDRVAGHFSGHGLPTHPQDIPGTLPGPDELLRLMYQDKKTVAGKLTFVLTRGIGQAFIAHDVAESDVRAFLEDTLSRQ